MNSYYLLLDLAAIAGPIALSFDKRVRYFEKWRFALLSCLITAIPFIIWDMVFTENAVWGFNKDYLIGISVHNLPLEEVLFFIVVPFSCIFIYECCRYYIPIKGSKTVDLIVSVILLSICVLSIIGNPDGFYSLISSLVGVATIIFWKINRRISHLGYTFLFSLIPFIIMNGALTGLFTSKPVVWYNDLETIGFRLLTIPIHDVVYGMSLIFITLFIYHRLFSSRLNHQSNDIPSDLNDSQGNI